MAKFCGKIGFAISQDFGGGVWEEVAVERIYYGDVLKYVRRNEVTQQVIDNVNVSNSISIVSDDYASENCANIRYAEYMGSLWKVTAIDVQRPRLILSLGGVYNGPTSGTPDDSGDNSGEY